MSTKIKVETIQPRNLILVSSDSHWRQGHPIYSADSFGVRTTESHIMIEDLIITSTRKGLLVELGEDIAYFPYEEHNSTKNIPKVLKPYFKEGLKRWLLKV